MLSKYLLNERDKEFRPRQVQYISWHLLVARTGKIFGRWGESTRGREEQGKGHVKNQATQSESAYMHLQLFI